MLKDLEFDNLGKTKPGIWEILKKTWNLEHKSLKIILFK